MKKMDLCRPCMEAIKAEWKKLRPLRLSIGSKVTCARCQRRRYGATYELTDKKA